MPQTHKKVSRPSKTSNPKSRSSQSAWEKQMAKFSRMAQKNKQSVGVLACIVGLVIYFMFFVPHRTKDMAFMEDVIEDSVYTFKTNTRDLQKQLSREVRSRTDMAELREFWAGLTAWQRQAVHQENKNFCIDHHYERLMGKKMVYPNTKHIFALAVPDMAKELEIFMKKEENLWTLFDNVLRGNDRADMSVISSKQLASTNFWTPMDGFTESEILDFNHRSWWSVRTMFLNKYFIQLLPRLKAKKLAVLSGDVEWPEQPVPPPTWAEEASAPDVVHADDDSFHAAVSASSKALVMFYAPWCGHCKKFKPDFAGAATALQNHDISLIGVDSTIAIDVSKEYAVASYPTIKYVDSGVASDYDGARTKFGVLEWLNEAGRFNGALTDDVEAARPPKVLTWEEEGTAPAVVHADDETFEAVVKSKSQALVMFYAPWCGHCKKIKPDWAAAAETLADQDVAIIGVDATVNLKLATEYEVKSYPTIKYISNLKKKQKTTDFDGTRSHFGILEFLNAPGRLGSVLDDMVEAIRPPKVLTWEEDGSGPDVLHATDETFAKALKSKAHALVMFYAPWCGHCKRFKPDFAAAATALKDQDVSIIGVDATVCPKLASKYEIKSFPTINYMSQGKVVKYEGARDKMGILNWLNAPEQLDGILDDTIEVAADMKPVSAWETEGSAPDVLHATDETFETAIKSKSHALVMFYAPWCGHCQKFKPDFAAAATALVDEDLAIIAVDATLFASLAAEYEVKDYPTIKYMTSLDAHHDLVADYTGTLTLEGVVSWLNDADRLDGQLDHVVKAL